MDSTVIEGPRIAAWIGQAKPRHVVILEKIGVVTDIRR
jgi:hypothetical protein